MAVCFPQDDLGEAQLFRQELEQLMVDSGSERPGRYLCRTAWGPAQWEVAAFEDVSSRRRIANQEPLTKSGLRLRGGATSEM